MADESRIRINALLLQREGLFVRVHEIESRVNDILGEPWPFEPPSLPSMRRSKAKPAKKRGASPTAKGNEETKLRKLDEARGETAYRVSYIQRGQNREEVHDTPEALQTLLAAQGTQLRVTAIDVIDANGAVVSRVYPADAAE